MRLVGGLMCLLAADGTRVCWCLLWWLVLLGGLYAFLVWFCSCCLRVLPRFCALLLPF